MEEKRYDFDRSDVVADVIFFFLTVAVAFGWMMLMLLIISFVSLSYLHFHIKTMFALSVAFAILAALYYIWKMVRKYRGKTVRWRR